MALYCSYCGTTLPDDAAFCFKCGRAVPGTAEADTSAQQISIDEMGITLPADEQILYRGELGDQAYSYEKGSYLVLTRRRILVRWGGNKRLEQIPISYIRSVCVPLYPSSLKQIWIDIGRKSQFHQDGIIRLTCKDKDQASEIVSVVEQIMLQAGSSATFG